MEAMKQIILLCVSSIVALLLAEILARQILDAADYLKVEKIDDSILGHRIDPSMSSFDAWGFRNPSVPASADIVAIGDSQTYGVSVTSRNAWPAQLARLTGKTVYNLALGGYGPVQYLHLLKTKALSLSPKVVIVGLYFGNDLLDAHRMTHKETPRAGRVSAADSKMLRGVRDWLARHSVIYGMTSIAVGARLRLAEVEASESDSIVIVEDPARGFRTGLTPQKRLAALDLSNQTIMEGLKITLEAIHGMMEVCKAAGIKLLVVLIPTKESVYSEHVLLKNDTDAAVFSSLVINESWARQFVQESLLQSGVEYVDTLPTLTRNITKSIYPESENGHPNVKGYRLIAEAVQKKIELASTVEQRD
jgi:hypothetical protein